MKAIYIKKYSLLIFSILVLMSGCKKDYFVRGIVDDDIPISQMELPEVVTLEVTKISQISATSGGEVINNGGGTIRSAGICWSTSPSPNIDDFVATNGTTKGQYASLLSRLKHSTTYYVRAYATNDKGTSYGEELSFVTPTPLAPVKTLEIEQEAGFLKLGGIVLEYSEAAAERGIVWSTIENPTIEHNKMLSDDLTDEFFVKIPLSLINMTETYRVRAYTISAGGLSYGETVYFNGTYPLILDIDGNVYTQVTIGNQIWMAENFKAKKFRNGDAISGLIQHTTSYFNDYGQLYPGTVVTDPRNIAPEGWRVATVEDWRTLINTLGGYDQGGKLKSTSQWNAPNVGATNSTGFSAIGSGFSGGGGAPGEIGAVGFYWTSSVLPDNRQWRFALVNDATDIYEIPQDGRSLHMSVRLIKEE